MRALAIESSCDETSASIVELSENKISVISDVTATSLSLHATTGGIIPENAARMQVKYILRTIIEALNKSATKRLNSWEDARSTLENEVDAIAVTYGPGLIGSLLVGVETTKTLSYVLKKPIIPVNHLLGHLYANYIDRQQDEIRFPFIGLIVSGGHTDLLFFRKHEEFIWLGGTRDDAAGEAFDKTGRMLNLSYPAGPEIENRASRVEKTNIKFKSPIINEDNFDFSFSGLKTEVSRFIQQNPNMSEGLRNEVCHALQKAIFDVLLKKTLRAAKMYSCKTILVGGGVAANQTFRDILEEKALAQDANALFPEKKYSTDNASMIGAYALLNFKPIDWEKINADPELYFA